MGPLGQTQSGMFRDVSNDKKMEHYVGFWYELEGTGDSTAQTVDRLTRVYISQSTTPKNFTWNFENVLNKIEIKANCWGT